MQEIEIEEHFVFWCPTYYGICGWFYFLFRESPNSLSTFF
jgi:hypothetical protein